MTTEEKAKRYDEALERARKMYNSTYHSMEGPGGVCYNNADLETIFPELRESKDERIKNLIYCLIRDRSDNIKLLEQNGVMVEEALDWLEKQGEHAENNEDDSDTDFTIYHPLKNGKGCYECIPYSFYGTLTSFSEDKDLIDFLRLCFYTKEECNEWIKKQGEQKTADKVEPKFKVKYAGNEYNVFETKDIAGVTFYGIEDEPNHIDYVKAENCEIISVYAIKEKGSPYPTKPAVFSEKKPKRMISAEAKEALYDKPTDEEMKELLRTEYEKGRADTLSEMKSSWSEVDDIRLQACIDCLQAKSLMGKVDTVMTNWLKSLKQRIKL